jgi:hypothetical protein
MIVTEETEMLRETPVQLSLCPQFPLGLTCDRNWVSPETAGIMTRVIRFGVHERYRIVHQMNDCQLVQLGWAR